MSYLGSGAAPQATQIGTNSVETQDIQDGAVTQAKLSPSISLGVRVSSVSYPGDDTAADTAGGQTITVTGAGFSSTPTVYVDTTIAPSVTYVSSTQITFTAPAKAAGTYNLFVINPDGSTAIHVMGMSYSGTPAWTTPAGSLGTVNGAAISIQLAATGDAPLVYTLSSGSSLPAGVSLSSSGLISGSLGTVQTISFSVDVTDAQNQTTPRSFSVTISLGEAYFRHVTLLLHGNGTNNAQNNTFLDSSTNAFTITRNGNTTQGTFSPFSRPDGRWSNYFSASYASIAYNSSICDFGTGAFTMELWAYCPAAANNVLLSTYNYTGNVEYGWFLGTNASGYPYFTAFAAGGNAAQTITSSTAIVANTWNHIAISRDGSSNAKLFLNGQLVASSSSFTQNIAYNNSFLFGTTLLNGGPQSSFTGYMSNVRVVKGSAVYTSAFTPSTSPLTAITNTTLLTCQSNRFKDNSTNNFTFTPVTVSVQPFSPFPTTSAYAAGTNGGSGYFDGSGDFLTASYSTSSFDWWTGDYTLEAWVYPTSLSGWSYVDGPNAVPTLIGNSTTTSTSSYFSFGPMSDGSVMLRYWNGSATNAVASSAGLVRVNQWNHIQFTKSSSGIRVGVNGTSTSASAVSGTPQSSSSLPLTIGQINNTAINGYVSGLRVVKGTALYDATTYTVPTSSPTAISNTNLLLNFTNGGIIDHSMSTNLETVGNAQISTTQSKWGGASMYFDGTGDYLVALNQYSQFSFGTGDFTVEGWIYLSGTPASAGTIIDTRSSDALAEYHISISSSNKLDFIYSSSRVTSATSISNTTWTHFAITRSSGTIRLFINGTLDANTASYSGTVNASATPAIGGGRSGGTSAINGYYFNGYIDDLRITKGYARYTSNFTAPAGPFEDNGV